MDIFKKFFFAALGILCAFAIFCIIAMAFIGSAYSQETKMTAHVEESECRLHCGECFDEWCN